MARFNQTIVDMIRRAASGVFYLTFETARTITGLVLNATGGAGLFSISRTVGSVETLLGEASVNNTKTDVVCWTWQLPAMYRAGQPLSLIVNCNRAHSTGSATNIAGTNLTSQTIDASVYQITKAGVVGADLVSTAAQTGVTTNAGDFTFVVDPTGLLPGDRFLAQLTQVVVTPSTVTQNANLNSARFELTLP